MLAVLNSIDDVVNPSTALIPPLSTSSSSNSVSSSSTTFVAPSLSPTIQQSAPSHLRADRHTHQLAARGGLRSDVQQPPLVLFVRRHKSERSASCRLAPPAADCPPPSSSLFCRTIVQRKQLLDSVPRRTLANAAYACHAFTPRTQVLRVAPARRAADVA